jgi:hypothetical protein
MGERARQLVVDRFSLPAVLDLWENLYGELLERRLTSRKNLSNDPKITSFFT